MMCVHVLIARTRVRKAPFLFQDSHPTNIPSQMKGLFC